MNNNNNRQIGFGGGGGGAEQQQQHHSQHLGVNKISKSIRKSPIHQTNFSINTNNNNKQPQQQQNPQPQPQVYNINKNDFRNIVQQLTGTPTRDPTPNPTPVPSVPPLPRPTNTSRSPSMRLQRIRPPPLAPIARPAMPIPIANPSHNPNPNLAFYPRAPPAQAPAPVQPNPFCANAADSPVSVYMRYLENSILNPDGSRQIRLPPPQARPAQAQFPPYGQQNQTQLRHQPLPSSGPLLMPVPAPQQPAPIGLPSPAAIGPPLRAAMPSPSAFFSLLSPRSPYPSLSPRFQVAPPLSPTFMLSPLSQSGGLLGSFPQPLPSPGSLFPPSPSGFLLSPRRRDM